ncbi:ROK family transcriptional regulator [Alicyclobacillus acidiphilus]|uniref:ROK family transcriptional regulator n=1 Tax=Alicyclobacillus acidiphilus TaxID=182455 RepID=UPI0008371621|nr:ROK family transcriptional regulator [Alicyclobacillus acidiphilus]
MKGNPELLRQLNERRIFNTIRLKGPISRVALQRQTNLTLPTVSRAVETLLEHGWVRSIGVADSSGGRPPEMLEICAGGAGAIGVEIGRQEARVVYVNLVAEVEAETSIDIHELDGPNHLIAYLQNFIETYGVDKSRILGVGVAAPGTVDAPGGRILYPSDLPEAWHGAEIVQQIGNGLHLQAWIENDANAAALGETWFGKGLDKRHSIFILADAGVGAGVVIDGKIYSGSNSTTGEFSHTIVDIHGETCICGRRGCLNTAVSIYNIDRAIRAGRSRADGESFDTVIANAKRQLNPDADVLHRFFEYLSVGISNLVQVLDPGMVILGGRMLLADSFMTDSVIMGVREICGDGHFEILPTSFGMNAVAVGAATLVLQSLFDHTQLVAHP